MANQSNSKKVPMGSNYYQLNPWRQGSPPQIGIRREMYLRNYLTGKIAGILLAPIALPILIVGYLSLHCAIGSSDDCLGYTATADT